MHNTNTYLSTVSTYERPQNETCTHHKTAAIGKHNDKQ